MTENVEMYGPALDSERLADEKLWCRELVKQLMDYGLSQRQMMFTIYLLASELENVEHMKQLTESIRDLAGSSLFIVDRAED